MAVAKVGDLLLQQTRDIQRSRVLDMREEGRHIRAKTREWAGLEKHGKERTLCMIPEVKLNLCSSQL